MAESFIRIFITLRLKNVISNCVQRSKINEKNNRTFFCQNMDNVLIVACIFKNYFCNGKKNIYRIINPIVLNVLFPLKLAKKEKQKTYLGRVTTNTGTGKTKKKRNKLLYITEYEVNTAVGIRKADIKLLSQLNPRLNAVIPIFFR